MDEDSIIPESHDQRRRKSSEEAAFCDPRLWTQASDMTCSRQYKGYELFIYDLQHNKSGTFRSEQMRWTFGWRTCGATHTPQYGDHHPTKEAAMIAAKIVIDGLTTPTLKTASFSVTFSPAIRDYKEKLRSYAKAIAACNGHHIKRFRYGKISGRWTGRCTKCKLQAFETDLLFAGPPMNMTICSPAKPRSKRGRR